MRFFSILCAVLLYGKYFHQGNVTVHSGDARVTLSNFESGSMDGFKEGNKEKHVDIKGNPAQIVSPEKGLTVTGKELEFTWAELDPKTMEFRKGRIEGNGIVTFDNNVAFDALTEDAAKRKTPPPAEPTEKTNLRIQSDLFNYSGDVKQGLLEMPGPWNLTDTAKGTKIKTEKNAAVNVDYDQTFDADGSKGQLTLVPGPNNEMGQIQKGSFEGPVHFKLVRHERVAGAPTPTTTTYTGVADHVDIDLTTTPGTVTARGHVTVDAESDAYQAHFIEAEFSFLVDDKLQPLGLKFSGMPGQTTAKALPKGGKQ